MDFPWPEVDGRLKPRWTGDGFVVGDATLPVLSYGGVATGWSDALTHLHESSAGADHPIDELSRRWTLSALKRHVTAPAPTLLEVGCSSGFLMAKLRAEWPSATVIGSDVVTEPLARLAAREPGLPLMQFDLVRCPLPDSCVDAVIAINVLEHIEDDRAAMGQLARIVKPGGIVVIEVPAGPHLYDLYDELLQHYRRYSAKTLASLCRGGGLTILEQSHLGATVYPAFALVKRRNQKRALDAAGKRARVEENIHDTGGSRLLSGVLRCEAWLGRFVSYPFGIRCVAVARRQQVGA